MRRASCIAAIGLLACSSPARPPEPELPAPPPEPSVFDHIDADTPYLFAILEPDRHLDASLAALGEILRLRARLPGGSRALAGAIEATLGGPLSRERLARLGLDLGEPLALAGLGLYPSLRIAVRAPDRVAAAIDQVAEATALEESGRRTWTARVGQLTLVIGVGDDQLGIALVPPALAGQLAPQIAGTAVPERSIAGSGRLDDLTRRYRLRQRVGYLDLVGLTGAVFGPGRATAGDVSMPALVDQLGVPFPDRCRHALVELAGEIPRVVYGVRARSARREESLVAIEIDSAIGARLHAATSAMPGLDGDTARSAELTFGLGVRPSELLELLADGLDALAAAPACGLGPRLDSVRDQLRVSARSMRPIAGLALAVARYVDDHAELRGVGAALLDDAPRFYSSLATWMPQLSILRGQTAPITLAGLAGFVHAGDEIFAVGLGLEDPGPVDDFAAAASATTTSTLLRVVVRGELARRWQEPEPEPELEARAPELARRLAELVSPVPYRSLELEVRPRRERIEIVIDMELRLPSP